MTTAETRMRRMSVRIAGACMARLYRISCVTFRRRRSRGASFAATNTPGSPGGRTPVDRAIPTLDTIRSRASSGRRGWRRPGARPGDPALSGKEIDGQIMRILIAGGGQVGILLAQRLIREGNEVTIVEAGTRRCAELEAQLDAKVVQGSAASVTILRQAGVADAEMVIAVTDIDEVNILACLVAQAESPAGSGSRDAHPRGRPLARGSPPRRGHARST